jgi:DNA mismatch repair protein MutL
VSNRIRKLEPEIANQIAAGEVIERPSNAVKELVENALDAGARRINIDIEDGGKKLIRVRDDGSGMNASDAVLCLQRHATSKLRDAHDLWAINTLGFRGEALPSIAAVSRLEINTRETGAEAGTRVAVEAGVVTDVSESGCAEGTEIVIRDLFFNTPARFKFLKSDAAEAARTAEMIGHLALAYPDVAFRLRHNGNELLRVEAGGNPFNAVVCVLGSETARQMLPIAPSSEDETSPVKVTGFVGRPQMTRANRNTQIFYINGRVVKNRTIQHALSAAYEGLIHGGGRFPVAVIFIQMPPGAVDVNVHPTKSEVRFAREWEIHHAVRIAARETLAAAQLTPDWQFQPRAVAPQGSGDSVLGARESGATDSSPHNQILNTQPPGDYRGFSQPVAPTGGDINAFRAAYPQPQAPNWQPPTQQPNHPTTQQPNNLFPDYAPPEEKKLSLRPLAQISHNAYILCEAEDGLYIVCQHRAHERILADRAIEAAEGRAVESQRLVIPFTAEIGPRAAAALEENAEMIKNLGFEVESFGGSSVLVRAVPTLVAHGDYQTAFSDLLDEMISSDGKPGRTLQDKRRALLTMLSCKNAIKAGDPLQPEQMQRLVEDLMTVSNPGICPHGQPILIKISTLELDKKFEREYASR